MTATIYHMPCSNSLAELMRDADDTTARVLRAERAREDLMDMALVAESFFDNNSFNTQFKDLKGVEHTVSYDIQDVCVAISEHNDFDKAVIQAHRHGDCKPLLDLIRNCSRRVAFDAMDMDDKWDDLASLQYWATMEG